MGGKETIECQINCFSINHFYKTVDNKVIEFPLHLTDLTFNNLTDHVFHTNIIAYCQQNWYEQLGHGVKVGPGPWDLVPQEPGTRDREP